MICKINILFSFFVYCPEQLDIHDDVKKTVDHGLEVEKVCVATESVDPSDPHEEGVLH